MKIEFHEDYDGVKFILIPESDSEEETIKMFLDKNLISEQFTKRTIVECQIKESRIGGIFKIRDHKK